MERNSTSPESRYLIEAEKRDRGLEYDELFVLSFEVRSLKTKKEEAENIADAASKDFEAAKAKLIRYMEDHSLEGVKVDGVGSFSPVIQSFPKIINQDELFEWLRSSGHGDVIKTSVHSSTLRAINADYEGRFGCALPGCESFLKTNLQIRK